MVVAGSSNSDHPSRILQIRPDDDKSFSKLSSKDHNFNNGEVSFRVNYYNGVSGAVPFIWEARPGTPKHPVLLEETSLPPLTPPPSYLFNPKLNDSRKKNSRSKIFYSIFPRNSFKESTHEAASFSSSSISSSSLSSSFSAPSTPRDMYISRSCKRGHRRSRSVVNFGLDEDEMPATSSTMCFGGRGYKSSGDRKLKMYSPIRNMKNALLSFVGGSGTAK